MRNPLESFQRLTEVPALSQRVSWLLCEAFAAWSSAKRSEIAALHNKYFDQIIIINQSVLVTAQIIYRIKTEQTEID